MTKPAATALETDARNAFYKDDGRRAWALVAFMVEHEQQVVVPDGATLQRQRESDGRAFFRAGELCKHMIPACAGFGGYHHPRAPSNNRALMIKEMAKDAEREGWISREPDRHGGIYRYALTDGGRIVYREAIAPQRDAFVEHYLKAREAMVRQTVLPAAEVPTPTGHGGGGTAKEDRIGKLQKRYERPDSVSDRHWPAGGRRGRD